MEGLLAVRRAMSQHPINTFMDKIRQGQRPRRGGTWFGFSNWKAPLRPWNASLICCMDAWNLSPGVKSSDTWPNRSSVTDNPRIVMGIWADSMRSETYVGAFSGTPFWGKKKMTAKGPGEGRARQWDTNHKTSHLPRTQPVTLIIPTCHSLPQGRALNNCWFPPFVPLPQPLCRPCTHRICFLTPAVCLTPLNITTT